MEAGHVATTTKWGNVRKGKTKIKVYRQADIVGVSGAGASTGRETRTKQFELAQTPTMT